MKKIFNQLFSMLASAIPYAFLAVYLFYITKYILFLPIFLGLSFVSFGFYWFYSKEKEIVAKKQYIIMTGLSASVVFSIFLLFGSIIDNVGSLMLTFTVIASLPVLYNACGIANETIFRENQSVLSYVLGIFLVPFSVFLLFNIAIGVNIESVFLIILTCGFYAIGFMIINIFFIFYKRKGKNIIFPQGSKNYYKITFVLGLFMPLTGLMINASLEGLNGSGGVFGDFSSPVFYLIALINGVLLMLPPQKNTKLRLILFFLKSAGYTYIIYFFIVFLPIIPTGILALIILIGIYVFAPLFITFWQGKILWSEFIFLKNYFNKWIIATVFVMGILTLPTALFSTVYNDRPNLERAAQYLINIPLEEYQEVNLPKLNRSLILIDSAYSFTNRRMDAFETGYSQGNIPILSNLYKEYVLYNQIISMENIGLLRNIFFDEQLNIENNNDSFQASRTNPVKLSAVTVSTTFDSDIQAYRSWIDLELKNVNEGRQEFRTTFKLPEGVYISDYYLYVSDEKKMGLLTDERAAIFVYNSIVRKQLDPGLLHYINDKTLELRVFPFQENELRKTGFELIHKQKFDFNLDGETISVDGDNTFSNIEVSGTILLSSESIKKLPIMEREPQYNFVIDCSNNSNIEILKKEVVDYTKQKGIANANVYFASYKVDKSELSNMDMQKMKNQGGFNLNLAVKKIFSDTPKDRFPVIISVTDNMPCAVFPEKTKADLFPESSYYYALNNNFTLTPYSFSGNEKQESIAVPIIEKVVSFDGIAIKNDGQNKIVVLSDDETELTDNQYENAILLRAETLKNTYNGKQTSISHIRKSFRANVLTQETAFIVVETSEQEKELLSLQEKILNGTNIESTPIQNLSEPSVYILIGLLLIIILIVNNLKKVKDISFDDIKKFL